MTFVLVAVVVVGAGTTGGLLIQLWSLLRARGARSLLSELYPAGGKIDLELLDLFGRELHHGSAQRSGGQALEG